MKFLTSIVNDDYTLDKLGHDKKSLVSLLETTGLDGFEILMTELYQKELFTKDFAVGNHLYFYPIWMDFIKGDFDALLKEFKDEKSVFSYYGAKTKKDYIENIRKELIKAKAAEYEYVVFHVSHMTLEESFTGNYKYSDFEVASEFIDVLNQAVRGLDLPFWILLENNWYPGLTFLDNDITSMFIDELKHDKVGFVLDTGHLIHTDTGIKTEEDAVTYIMSVLTRMGDLKSHIKCIHLNLSLSGEYREKLNGKSSLDFNKSFFENMNSAMEHIRKIDNHNIFHHNKLKDLIFFIKPLYVVFELSFKDKEDLINKISKQDSYIGMRTLSHL
ncbi:MAG: TIM barrel protein [Clostridiaceae bacterium]